MLGICDDDGTWVVLRYCDGDSDGGVYAKRLFICGILGVVIPICASIVFRYS